MSLIHYRISACRCLPDLSRAPYQSRMERLPCGAWHISGVADIQGVRFSKGQAIIVAFFLNVARLVGIRER